MGVLLPLLFLLLQFTVLAQNALQSLFAFAGLLTVVLPAHDAPSREQDEGQRYEQLYPAAFPPEWRHHQFQHVGIVGPYSVAIGAPDLQTVVARRQVAKGNVWGANVVPLGVAVHAPGILNEAVVRVVEGCEADGQVALVGADNQRVAIE